MPSSNMNRHRLVLQASYRTPLTLWVVGLIALSGVGLVYKLRAGDVTLNPLWVLEPSASRVGEHVARPARWARMVPLAVAAKGQSHAESLLVPLPQVSPPVVSLARESEAAAAVEHVETTPVPLSQPLRTFNGLAIRKVKTMRMLVTAYSPDARSCGNSADNITASGYSVWTNGMKMVAADTRLLPFGSIITVPGYDGGNPVPVMDRGGAIKGMRLDVLYPTHEAARVWGKQWLDVEVWQYADK